MANILIGGVSKTEDISTLMNGSVSNRATSGVAGNLEYVKMLQNPRLTVKIVTPKKKVITSALASDFGFSLGNSWSPLVPLSSLPLVGDIGQGVSGIFTAIAGATQFSIESLWMTSASWTGSKLPTFPVSLVFLNYSSQIDLMSDLLGVAEGTLSPSISYDSKQAGAAEDLVQGFQDLTENVSEGAVNLVSTIGSTISNIGKEQQTTPEQWLSEHEIAQNIATTLKHSKQWATAAPCNYGLQVNSDLDGSAFLPKEGTTFALRIGEWFEASQLLIENVNVRFSKEISPNGTPLLLYLDVTFRPYRNITFSEFSKYFRKKSSSSGGLINNLVSKIGGKI